MTFVPDPHWQDRAGGAERVAVTDRLRLMWNNRQTQVLDESNPDPVGTDHWVIRGGVLQCPKPYQLTLGDWYGPFGGTRHRIRLDLAHAALVDGEFSGHFVDSIMAGKGVSANGDFHGCMMSQGTFAGRAVGQAWFDVDRGLISGLDHISLDCSSCVCWTSSDDHDPKARRSRVDRFMEAHPEAMAVVVPPRHGSPMEVWAGGRQLFSPSPNADYEGLMDDAHYFTRQLRSLTNHRSADYPAMHQQAMKAWKAWVAAATALAGHPDLAGLEALHRFLLLFRPEGE